MSPLGKCGHTLSLSAFCVLSLQSYHANSHMAFYWYRVSGEWRDGSMAKINTALAEDENWFCISSHSFCCCGKIQWSKTTYRRNHWPRFQRKGPCCQGRQGSRGLEQTLVCHRAMKQAVTLPLAVVQTQLFHTRLWLTMADSRFLVYLIDNIYLMKQIR